ncbi:MAG: putative membrane protein [Bacteroidetes bacterium HLUCCA01]|nr:MAG: putative membrane protein [Bacteroidetes bacterium HLUCCA01]
MNLLTLLTLIIAVYWVVMMIYVYKKEDWT